MRRLLRQLLRRTSNRAASADGAACAAAEKHKVAKYKEVMRLSPTAQFIPFIMEANGRLGKEAQKLLLHVSLFYLELYVKLSKYLSIYLTAPAVVFS
jgi:hypothetical protein